jgi:hypothetical protein
MTWLTVLFAERYGHTLPDRHPPELGNSRPSSRLRERLVKVARSEGLTFKQSYKHVGRRLLM